MKVFFTFSKEILSSTEGKCKDLKHLQVEVSTSRGIIYGFHVDYGNDASKLYFGSADVFLGIPYARQPVGHLRFAVNSLCTWVSSLSETSKSFLLKCFCGRAKPSAEVKSKR